MASEKTRPIKSRNGIAAVRVAQTAASADADSNTDTIGMVVYQPVRKNGCVC